MEALDDEEAEEEKPAAVEEKKTVTEKIAPPEAAVKHSSVVQSQVSELKPASIQKEDMVMQN